jgi:hypothetical protein
MRKPWFLAVFAFVLVASAGMMRAADDTTDKPLDPDAAKRWQELHDQNLVLQEQQKQVADQQSLLKTFLPTLPQGVTPGFERKGDLSVKGTAAAYQSLQVLSGRFARNVAGVSWLPEDCHESKPKAQEDCESRNAEKYKTAGATKTYTSIWLHGEREAKAMAQLPVFNYQLQTLICQLAIEAHVTQSDCAPPPKNPPIAPAGLMGALGPAAIAPLVQTALGIFELFRTKVTVTASNVPADEMSFTAMVAGDLRKLNTAMNIYYPSVFPLPISGGASPLLTKVTTLRTLTEKLALQVRDLKDQQTKQTKATAKADAAVTSLKSQIKDAGDRINELDERIAITPDKEQRMFWETRRADATTTRAALQKKLDEEAQPAADTADAASDTLAASIKEVQDLTDKAIAFQNSLYEKVDDDTLLAKLLRLESMSQQWQACPAPGPGIKTCAALQLTVVSAGAEMKTSQNYWTTGESIGGGSIASYLLYEPKTGNIIDGGSDSQYLDQQGR